MKSSVRYICPLLLDDSAIQKMSEKRRKSASAGKKSNKAEEKGQTTKKRKSVITDFPPVVTNCVWGSGLEKMKYVKDWRWVPRCCEKLHEEHYSVLQKLSNEDMVNSYSLVLINLWKAIQLIINPYTVVTYLFAYCDGGFRKVDRADVYKI